MKPKLSAAKNGAILSVAALAVCVLALYVRTLGYEYVWDDLAYFGTIDDCRGRIYDSAFVCLLVLSRKGFHGLFGCLVADILHRNRPEHVQPASTARIEKT